MIRKHSWPTILLIVITSFFVISFCLVPPSDAAADERTKSDVLSVDRHAEVARPADKESSFWNFVKIGKNPEDFEAYLFAYPSGRFASQARKFLAALKRPAWAGDEKNANDFAPKKINPSSSPSGMAHVNGGCFYMGDQFGEGDSIEKPFHKVCLDDFYMDKYLVSQGAYEKAVGRNPSAFSGMAGACPECPVVLVDWDQSNAFCKSVGKRLPTEAEWEYSARSGGKNERWAGTSDRNMLAEFAWFDQNSDKERHSVGQKKPNGLGLYDMNGSVHEWVADWYHADYYKQSPEYNPKGPSSGQYKVLRGGSLYDDPNKLRASSRIFSQPEIRYRAYGFRCAN